MADLWCNIPLFEKKNISVKNKLLVCRWNPTVTFSMEIKLMVYKNLHKWTGNDGKCIEEFSLDEHGVNPMA